MPGSAPPAASKRDEAPTEREVLPRSICRLHSIMTWNDHGGWLEHVDGWGVDAIVPD